MEVSEVAKVYSAMKARQRRERWEGVMLALLTVAGFITLGLVVKGMIW